jgi:hypothetical protein
MKDFIPLMSPDIRKDDILSEDDEIKLLENGTKRNTEKDWLYYGRNKGFAKWSKY